MADLGELVLLRSPNGLPFCLVEHLGEEDRPAPVTWRAPGSSEQVSSLVDQLCIDVSAGAFDREVTWWSGLLAWGSVRHRARSSPSLSVLPGSRCACCCSAGPRARRSGQRPRTCTWPAPTEVARHIGLGARHVGCADRWDTLLDPAGRPYCIIDRNPSTGNMPS